MLAALDALAKQLNVDRSILVRSLLSAGLNEPAKKAAAREVIMLLSSQRKRVLAQFNNRLQEVVDEMAAAVEQGS